MEVEMLQLRGKVAKMKGTARVDGKVVAEAEMLAGLVDR
jgi:3-hydroxymyristoyl/3-hydroxydecanoyl-(acyl carrier protein) dehydratase